MLVLRTRLEAFMAHTCQLRLFKPWAALRLCVSRADIFFVRDRAYIVVVQLSLMSVLSCSSSLRLMRGP